MYHQQKYGKRYSKTRNWTNIYFIISCIILVLPRFDRMPHVLIWCPSGIFMPPVEDNNWPFVAGADFRRTKSIPLLLMHGLLSSPGHQHPRYCCIILTKHLTTPHFVRFSILSQYHVLWYWGRETGHFRLRNSISTFQSRWHTRQSPGTHWLRLYIFLRTRDVIRHFGDMLWIFCGDYTFRVFHMYPRGKRDIVGDQSKVEILPLRWTINFINDILKCLK